MSLKKAIISIFRIKTYNVIHNNVKVMYLI